MINAKAQAYPFLLDLITLKGKIPYTVALFSLTPYERLLLEIIRDSDHALADLSNSSANTDWLVVTLGENHLVEIGVCPAASVAPDQIECAVELSDQDIKKWTVARRKLQNKMEQKLNRVKKFLECEYEENRLNPFLDQTWDMLQHMPPFTAFIGKKMFTSLVYFGANLVGRKGQEGFLLQWRKTSPQKWPSEAQQLVFGIAMLLQSGPYYRLEEMNWMQLDPLTLDEFFDRQISSSKCLLSSSEPSPNEEVPTIDKAHRIASLQNDLKKDFQVYRTINGLCLNKEIRWIPKKRVRTPVLPKRLVELLKLEFPNTLRSFTKPIEESLDNLARLAIEENKEARLLMILAKAALDDTQADFFMTRGPRYFGIPAKFSSLNRDQFYTLVLARHKYNPKEYGLRYTTNEMCLHQARRMQFNSWKFWYGNLTSEERSRNQYWFFPPHIPDIAVEEDQIHAGHRENGVVQSIRSSGPLILLDPQTYESRVFHAAYDARAVRTDREILFTENDLITTIQYRRWIGIILQSFANNVSKGLSPVEIQAFGSTFYIGSGFCA